MIRINLLPVRQVKKVQTGQRQLFIFAALIGAELLLMFSLYSMAQTEIDGKKKNIAVTQQEIEALKKEIGDFDQLKSQRDYLLQQRSIIISLQNARTGPVYVMRELSDILTAGKGPTIDHAKYEERLRRDPNSGFNPRWNPNRLWVESVVEKNGVLTIFGKAKDFDDVAEFNKRIAMSKYFKEDFLERNDSAMDDKMKLKVVKFSLRCKVTY